MQESIVDQLKEDRKPEANADERHQRVLEHGVRLRRVDRVDDRERDVLDVVDRVEADVMQTSVALAKVLEKHVNDVQVRRSIEFVVLPCSRR